MTFVKLNQKFPDIQYSEGGKAVSYGGIISYLELNGINCNLLDVIPDKYQDEFSLSLMKIAGEVPPHTDSDVRTVINFYVNSGNYKTVFFNGDAPTYQIKNQTNGKMYLRDTLVENGSFIAFDEDAYCLNVEKPHAVDALDDNPIERVAICLSTCDYDFEQVCSMLTDTRYLN